ncbi:hypothetical protein LCGC14_1622650 [marine sediment metagenome]|uniref:6-hydroxymethylpterin diphosphokinase MptE-like domain-containing protein n=1 Tax=marine sediment metagenome TaxID=412755 RepID=A0A0F9KKK6_9ZZZZ|nr:MAG: 6-hydroxymethyl-7,8-dihydropterin pyrophosphokinase [Candidatus Lokiarchaeum sp. GC14_75]
MDSNLKDDLNFFREFKDWYFKIINDFNFDYKEDYRAREYLSKILDSKANEWHLDKILFSFQKRIHEKSNIFIYGCGPSLEETVNYIIEKLGISIFGKIINLAADGAAVFLKEKLIPVDAIFTDLDGITITEFNYPDFLIIHAHGDNLDKIKQFENEIINFHNVIGTTQVEPVSNIISPGGFTDGDRILFFLRSLIKPYQKLFLIGMDFKNIVGKYSKLYIEHNREGSQVKKKKLSLAVELLEWVTPKIKNDIFFINSERISDKFKYITLDEYMNLFP